MGYELTGLTDKVAVVTGAGRMRAIGRAIAVALAKAGCDVVVTGTGRDPSHDSETVRESFVAQETLRCHHLERSGLGFQS